MRSSTATANAAKRITTSVSPQLCVPSASRPTRSRVHSPAPSASAPDTVLHSTRRREEADRRVVRSRMVWEAARAITAARTASHPSTVTPSTFHGCPCHPWQCTVRGAECYPWRGTFRGCQCLPSACTVRTRQRAQHCRNSVLAPREILYGACERRRPCAGPVQNLPRGEYRIPAMLRALASAYSARRWKALTTTEGTSPWIALGTTDGALPGMARTTMEGAWRDGRRVAGSSCGGNRPRCFPYHPRPDDTPVGLFAPARAVQDCVRCTRAWCGAVDPRSGRSARARHAELGRDRRGDPLRGVRGRRARPHGNAGGVRRERAKHL